MLLESPSTEGSRRKKKYTVKNPYFEDRDSYNLNACIQDRRKPIFGYALPELFDSKDEALNPEEMSDKHSIDFDFVLPSVVAMKREKQIMEHVYKCFTFGKPVRRDNPLVCHDVSRIDEIKQKFNRVKLIRRYFSVKRRNMHRKFDYPIDQLGRLVRSKGKKPDF